MGLIVIVSEHRDVDMRLSTGLVVGKYGLALPG